MVTNSSRWSARYHFLNSLRVPLVAALPPLIFGCAIGTLIAAYSPLRDVIARVKSEPTIKLEWLPEELIPSDRVLHAITEDSAAGTFAYISWHNTTFPDESARPTRLGELRLAYDREVRSEPRLWKEVQAQLLDRFLIYEMHDGTIVTSVAERVDGCNKAMMNFRRTERVLLLPLTAPPRLASSQDAASES